jgi:hypothetical protein
MIKSYTSTQARQNWSSVIKKVLEDGEVFITLRNNTKLVLKIDKGDKSPLDIPGINTKATMQDVIDSVRESREMDSDDRMKIYAKKNQ